MKKNILRIFLFLIISILSFSASFSISDLDVEAKLQKDGSMLVSQAVTYDIDEINGIYFDIDAKGPSWYRFRRKRRRGSMTFWK